MSAGQQHIHARRRLFKHLEPFPSRGAWKRALDYLMYGVGIVQPIALVPQIVSIYGDGQVHGVSITTWVMLAVFNALWALYGAVHRDRPIMISNILLTILDFIIVYGIVR